MSDPYKPTTIGNRYVEVTISPNGETKIEAHGFTGGACKAATKPLEEALGAHEQDRVLKSEDCAGVTVQA